MGLFNRKLKPQNTVTLVKDATGAAATDKAVVLTKGGVDLAKKFDKAGISLSKRGLNGIRAEVLLILDHSGSMHGNYQNGTVQQLVERALGFALQIDADGTVPVVRFDSYLHPAIDVDLGNYADVARTQLLGQMGSTDLALALEYVMTEAGKATKPLFVIVITDGVPDNTAKASALVAQLSQYPAFLKFLSLPDRGSHPGRRFLQGLDDMDGRLLDNADAKFIDDPAGMADLAFADAMTDEWDTWIAAATSAGLIR